MATTTSAHGARLGLILLLTAATSLAAFALGCATPFPAIAAVAALHMDRRDGVAFVLFAWAVSQAVGFGLRGFPTDASTLCLGAAIGGSALVSLAGATLLLRHTPVRRPLLAAAVALIGGFAAFKGAVLLPSLLLADGAHGFTPDVLGRQVVRNALFLVGLLALHRAATVAGLGAALPRRAAT